MARLANISGKEAVGAFQKAGWQPIGQVGSHLMMSKPGLRVNLRSPTQRAVRGHYPRAHPPRGMTVEEFLALL